MVNSITKLPLRKLGIDYQKFNIMKKYIERLFNEWKEHGNIIIGLDFDDTIFPYREDITDHEEVIATVKLAVSTGARVIIYTGSAPDRYDFIKSYCDKIGIKITAINENIIIPFGDNRKIYCNVYIDDRAGLTEALNILRQATYLYRAHKITESITNEQAE